MKKLIVKKNFQIPLIVALLITSVFLIKGFSSQFRSSTQSEEEVEKQLPSNHREAKQEQTKEIELTATKSGQTPFSLLMDNHEVEYDQYDSGVFVTAIDDVKANESYYWAVHVNDQYAQEAADQIKLQSGDQVKWVYEQVDQAQFKD